MVAETRNPESHCQRTGAHSYISPPRVTSGNLVNFSEPLSLLYALVRVSRQMLLSLCACKLCVHCVNVPAVIRGQGRAPVLTCPLV